MVGGRAALGGAVLISAASGFAAPAAHASAWSLPAGTQQWFATISRETGDFGEAWRADDYVEIGLGDGWSVTGKAEGQIRIGSTYDDRTGFKLGVQRAFAIGERASASVQVSFLGGESLDGPECLGEGFEARAAIGTSFSLGGREGFVNLEAGRRTRGDCNRNVIEAAAGLAFAPDWSLTVKAWRDGQGVSGSAKAEFALARDLGFISVGAGWRQEISGNFEEKGWVVSASSRF